MWVCTGLHGFAWVCTGLHGFKRLVSPKCYSKKSGVKYRVGQCTLTSKKSVIEKGRCYDMRYDCLSAVINPLLQCAVRNCHRSTIIPELRGDCRPDFPLKKSKVYCRHCAPLPCSDISQCNGKS